MLVCSGVFQLQQVPPSLPIHLLHLLVLLTHNPFSWVGLRDRLLAVVVVARVVVGRVALGGQWGRGLRHWWRWMQRLLTVLVLGLLILPLPVGCVVDGWRGLRWWQL